MNRLCILIIALSVSGCSHTYYLGALSDEQSRAFQKKSVASQFDVHLVDGRVLDGIALQVRADSLLWLDAQSNGTMQASADDVEFIGFNDRVAGGVEGVMLGFILGAAVGGVFGYMSGDECQGSEFCFNKGDTALIGGVVFGASMALFGGVFGALRGTRDSYYPGVAP